MVYEYSDFEEEMMLEFSYGLNLIVGLLLGFVVLVFERDFN